MHRSNLVESLVGDLCMSKISPRVCRGAFYLSSFLGDLFGKKTCNHISCGSPDYNVLSLTPQIPLQPPTIGYISPLHPHPLVFLEDLHLAIVAGLVMA